MSRLREVSYRIGCWALKSAVGLLTLALVLGSMLVLINWQDRPASESARQLERLALPQRELLRSGNAHPFLLAFSAPRDADPAMLGQVMLQPTASHADPAWKPDPALKRLTQQEPWNSLGFEATCTEQPHRCEPKLMAQTQAISAVLTEHDWVLRRYANLLAHTYNQGPSHRFDRPIPAYAAVRTAQRLYLLAAWQEALQGHAQVVQERLTHDFVFWRMMLAQSGTLVEKMLATRALRQHFAWGALMLYRRPEAIPTLWQQAFLPEEFDMGVALTAEWSALCAFFRDPDAWSMYGGVTSPLMRPLFNPQDSCNLYAEATLKQLALLRTGGWHKWPQLRSQMEAVQVQPTFRIYNPGLNLLIEDSKVDVLGWFHLIADLEGIRRLHLLALWKHQHPDTTPPTSWVDPYTDQPFTEVSEQHELVFTGPCRAPQQCRYIARY